MILKKIMEKKNWVVIGDVTNPEKYAHKILNRLKEKGYQADGVHPKGGKGVYKTLSEIKKPIEVIDLCIHPKLGIGYVKEAATLTGIEYILIQPGAESDEIIAFCEENNLKCFKGCALVGMNLYSRMNL